MTFSSRLIAFLLLAGLSFPVGLRAEKAVYESYFEDNLSLLVDWKATLPEAAATVAVRPLESADGAGAFPAALVIRMDAVPEPLRVAQVKELFELKPGHDYELRVTYRAPRVELEAGGRARFFVTDSRWTWSSPALSLSAPQGEWRTEVVPFSAPETGGHFRVRFEALKTGLELEVAKVVIVPVTP